MKQTYQTSTRPENRAKTQLIYRSKGEGGRKVKTKTPDRISLLFIQGEKLSPHGAQLWEPPPASPTKLTEYI